MPMDQSIMKIMPIQSAQFSSNFSLISSALHGSSLGTSTVEVDFFLYLFKVEIFTLLQICTWIFMRFNSAVVIWQFLLLMGDPQQWVYGATYSDEDVSLIEPRIIRNNDTGTLHVATPTHPLGGMRYRLWCFRKSAHPHPVWLRRPPRFLVVLSCIQ